MDKNRLFLKELSRLGEKKYCKPVIRASVKHVLAQGALGVHRQDPLGGCDTGSFSEPQGATSLSLFFASLIRDQVFSQDTTENLVVACVL